MAEESAKVPLADGSAPAEPAPRSRIGDKRHMGLVIEWKGYMGWVYPLNKVDHPQATQHKGRIYLNLKDVLEDGGGQKVKEGRIVDFYIYSDDDGLGAEECRAHSVLRLTLPHGEANKTLKHSPSWCEYLTDSEYYPAFEDEHGVFLRKYAWPMPFAVLELWGQPETLASTAVSLCAKGDDCSMRLLLPEDAVAKAESLPNSPKVSEKVVVAAPVPCRSLTLEGTKDRCTEAVKAFVEVMSQPAASAA